jgi:ATP-binding cassette subfamily B protein
VVFGAGAAAAPARSARRRIAALLAQPPLAGGTTAFPVGNDLRFRDVSFAYPASAGGRGDVLHGIDVTLPPGTVTAVVGPSGSGKTTFTRLAARFWDVDRGAVEIGGVDVRALSLDTLMRNVTCVFQDVALLNDTVEVNLRLGRPDADEADLTAAVKAADADAFIAALPAGYHTLIGERGTRLSRGERQRLQIARAFLKDAPIVILDEPTASMDPATEAEISDALVPLLRGKTVLIVAHRLATIVDADQIVVLDGTGRIEALGTHADLLQRSPTYAGMWSAYAGSPEAAKCTEGVAS